MSQPGGSIQQLFKLLNPRRFSQALAFAGHDVATLAGLSISSGVLLFFLEIGLAYSLQIFLRELGLANASAVSVPDFLVIQGVNQAVLLLCGIVVARALAYWAQYYFQHSSYMKFMHRLRSRLLRDSLDNGVNDTGATIYFFTERIIHAGNVLVALEAVLFHVCLATLLATALIIKLPSVAGLAIGLLAILYVPMKLFARKMDERGQTAQKFDLGATSRFLSVIKNYLLIRIYGLEEHEKQVIQKNLDSSSHNYHQYLALAGLSSLLPQIAGTVVIAVVAWFFANTAMSPGLLISFFYLFFRFLQSVSLGMSSSSNALYAWSQLDAVIKWWNSRRSALEQGLEKAPISRVERAAFGWKAQELDFTYPDSQKAAVRGINLEIRPKSTLVIKGPSGVGKSTLLSLLLGLLKPTSGTVQVYADTLKASAPFDLRTELSQYVGYVGPEPFIFHGTVEKNITYGLHHNVSHDELIEALKKAQCDFILNSSQGINKMLSDQGEGLSAGEKQRISLARALLRKPTVLILDEATSNLDSATEQKVITTIESLKNTMTMVVVTHRESLLRLADQTLELGK